MTAQVVAFPRAADEQSRKILRDALVELHALVSIDPVLGASPTRVYFVNTPRAEQLVAAVVGADDRIGDREVAVYALISYDFPYALFLLKGAGQLTEDRAKGVITRSSDLQKTLLRHAANTIGLTAQAIESADTGALKSAFFPNTQETVTHVFRLGLHAQ
jgi:hypothetical protein